MHAVSLSTVRIEGFLRWATTTGTPSSNSHIQRICRLVHAAVILADEARNRARMSTSALYDLGGHPRTSSNS